MPNIKPGVRTTEFWTTALTGVIAAAADLCAGFGWAFNADTFKSLVPVAATIAAGVAAHGYSGSRGTVKKELVTAQSYLEQSLMPYTPPPAPPVEPPMSSLTIALGQLSD
jgi:NO-binding membrane sensor protein with MHYT domain